MFEGTPADAFTLDRGYPVPSHAQMADMTCFPAAASPMFPHTDMYHTFEGTLPTDITGEFSN